MCQLKIKHQKTSKFGLDSFVFSSRKNGDIFLFFAMLLGAALQITNMFGDTLSEILVLN
jgi:NHS family xanthosine MFS transporter